MEVRVTHSIDKSDQRPDGYYDYYYEYDWFEFDFGNGRVLTGRRYSDEPKEAIALLGGDTTDGSWRVSFYNAPEADEVVRYLKGAGFSDIRVLGGPRGACARLDETRLGNTS